ncbi:hypothetical protein SteCoe_5418 [Stentor coeruleus]|uniref:Uncharacterized protein n=1 Tax=Stentor coeruleus TaxID=5963 RepID=A0A1R2CSN3_9CILI|nr:hypothetical protein SteCoe_5418 [Stentor coeruleus]
MNQTGEIFSPKETNGNSTDRFFCRVISRTRSKRPSSTPKSSYIDVSILRQKEFLRQKVSTSCSIKVCENTLKFTKRNSKYRKILRTTSSKIPHEYFAFRAVDPYINSKKFKFRNNTSTNRKLKENVKKNESLGLLSILRQKTQTFFPAKSQEKLELKIIVN